jgi:signal transduction histidine kinase/CheY-like chemotaxis protein
MNFISRIGLSNPTHPLSPKKAHNIVLANRMAFILAIVTAPYFFIFNLLSVPVLGYLIIPITGAYLFTIFLNKLGRYTTAKFLLLFTINVGAFGYAALLGRGAGIHHLYYLFANLPLMLFESEEKKSIIVGIAISILCWILLHIHFLLAPAFDPIITREQAAIIYYFATTGTFALILSIIYSHFLSREKVEKEIIVSNILLTQNNKKLQQSYEELQKSNDEKEQLAIQAHMGSFTRSIGHEISNPATAIISGCELILSRMDDDPVLAKKYAQKVLDTSVRLHGLSDRMLKYGSPATSHKQNVNVESILEDLTLLGAGEIRKKRIKTTYDFPPHFPEAWGDPLSLGNVFLNLVKNAVEASPEHGELIFKGSLATYTFDVRERKETFAPAITSSQQPPKENPIIETKTLNGICIEIRDFGQGISKENLAKLRDPLFSTKNRNSGLGLMFCYRTLEDHFGKIEIQSEEKKGSVVKVYLPTSSIQQIKETPPSVSKPLVHSTEKKTTILIVEDEEEWQEIMQDILSPHFNLIMANGLIQGFTAFLQNKDKIDLIFTDFYYEDSDASEFYEALAKLKTPLPKILVTSSMSRIETVTQKWAAGFIQKPLSEFSLRQKIEGVLAIKV